jgi:beta-glucosidase
VSFLVNRFFLLGIVLAATSLGAQETALPVCAGTLTHQELDARIDALIGQMTPAERIAQLQDRATAIPHLKIPAYNWWNEGLHGAARNGFATVFPQAIGMAATWDPELVGQEATVISTEARAKFNPHQNADSLRYAGLTIWSPNINIFRDPRWGRGQETYGEDPYLTALLGTQFVHGIQGDAAAVTFYRKADATPKHFAVHSGPESIRDAFDAKASEHDLADTYTPAFRALTGQDGARSAAIMCSYNRINGVPACANPILQDRLRDQWGFGGYVVSDCDAVGNITEFHHYTADAAHGAAAALKAGTDLDCGKTYAHLSEALDQKLVTIDDIDRSLHRLLLERFRLGMLQPASCSPYSTIGPGDVDTASARKLALKAAEEAMVLLKNDGNALPLAAGKRIAVIGPTADLLQVIEANYHGTAHHPETLLDGLKGSMAATFSYAQGSMLAEGFSGPVSRSALRVGTESTAAEGLKAEYFSNPDLSGTPATTRVDRTIDFDLDRAVPADGLKSIYSARWTGFLKPPAPGKYKLHVAIDRCWDCTTHDGYRLLIDGKVAVEDDGKAGNLPPISFDWAAAAPHAVTLEFRHTGEDEGIQLQWEAPAEAQLAEAVAAAKAADAVLAVVGLSPDLEGEAMPVKIPGFDGGDRVSLALPEPQRRLLAELAKLGKPTILVVTSGSAVALGEEGNNAQAIVEAWYPGEEGGHALAELISGRVNPSGRLPVTIYRSEADLPAFTDYSMAHRTYRYFEGPVEYPFGFGLSYSKFAYSPARFRAHNPDDDRTLPNGMAAPSGGMLVVSATVTNVGLRDGDEVAELYLIPPAGSGGPRLALQGVQRLHLKAGETGEARFMLTPHQLSVVDANGERQMPAGKYRIYVGSAQPADLATAGVEFEIESGQTHKP